MVAVAGCDDPGVGDQELAADDGDDNGFDTYEPAAEPPAGPRVGEDNTQRLNTQRLNTQRLNAAYLGLSTLESFDASGDYIATLDYKLMGNAAVEGVWLEGSELHILTDEGVELAGDELVGIEIRYDVDETAKGNGKKGKRVRLDAVAPIEPGSDILAYDFRLKDTMGSWEPLCVDAEGDPTEAIILAGSWNPDTGARAGEAGVITYACRGAALAKCVEWGYRPWATGGTDLAAYHQACTRMVVADYCGDGIAHTVDGTLIHVLDEVGIQELDPEMSFVVEAEWGPDGATCLNVSNTRIAGAVAGCEIPACGADFESGGLIQSGKPTSP